MLSTYKKPALVLIISVFLFAGIVFLLDFEPIDYVRTHFYNPSFVNSIVKENERDAEIVQSRILELQDRFASTLNEPAVQSSFLYNQTAADIYERSKVFGILVESISGLQSVQFVDSNGIRIHYSTSARDLISQSSNSASYRNYTDDSRALPYDIVSAGANENPKYTMDDSHDRIIFSFPFFDSMNVYRGTALFTVSVRALAERLIAAGSLKPNDDVSVIRMPRGVVFGSPDTSKSVILDKISSAWNEGLKKYVTLGAEDSGNRYALISTKTGNELFFGRLVDDSIFSIPDSMKFTLRLSMFLTLFLTLYFIINFKPHPVTLVQNRINTLRANLFEELYIKKTGQDRAKWILELEQRRDEIRSELKNKLRVKGSLENKIDEIIDKAWDELLAVMKSGYDLASLEKIVKTRTVKIEKPIIEDTEELDLIPVEEILDEVEEVEDIDEIEEVYEAEEAEEVYEIDEVDEGEEIEEAEEINETEDIEEFEEIDEIDEIIDETEKINSYTEIQISKGLLKAANEILSKIKKEEAKTSAPAHIIRKGLLQLAEEKISAPVRIIRKGLLQLAEAKVSVPVRIRKGLLQRAEEKAAAPARIKKGLLQLAIEFIKSKENKKAKDAEQKLLFDVEKINKLTKKELRSKERRSSGGLLTAALAYIKQRKPATMMTESLSVQEIDLDDYSDTDDDGQEFLFDMEITSPFSSMFSSLDNEKSSTSSMNAD
jgi:hypothetical protein